MLSSSLFNQYTNPSLCFHPVASWLALSSTAFASMWQSGLQGISIWRRWTCVGRSSCVPGWCNCKRSWSGRKSSAGLFVQISCHSHKRWRGCLCTWQYFKRLVGDRERRRGRIQCCGPEGSCFSMLCCANEILGTSFSCRICENFRGAEAATLSTHGLVKGSSARDSK